ncbi:hypothetical protein ZWY2020_016335 [Hordeum vulgare]|nr:hypothetical protein ZWY2020_016335 [Hordeum vulgare]
MTKGQTSKLESQKKKKKKKAAPAQRRQRALPAGWIQGDFLPSTVTTDDLLELVEQGMIANKSWRLPAEGEPGSALERESVLLLSHVYRCFSLPPDPFFRGIMNHFGAQLHHFPPNAIAHLSAFVVLCECFIGCHPHWGLFKYVFSARSQTVKKHSQLDDKTHILQLCGGLGFEKKNKSSYPVLQLSESVKNWQSTWFYCQDVACPNAATGLSPFSLDRPAPPRQLALTKMEKIQIQPLAWTNWYSSASNGNPAEEEEGSQEGSMDSVEYVSDSGETEEETEEEEGEVGEQSSPPPPPEPRTKTLMLRQQEHRSSSEAELSEAWIHSVWPPWKVGPWARQQCPWSSSCSEHSEPREELVGHSEPREELARHSGPLEELVASAPGDSSRRMTEGSGQALAPVLEAVPSAAAPATDAPPTETMSSTETVSLAAEPTGEGVGIPKESPVVPVPSTVQYDARHLPEDQVGAAKEAMVQAELMVWKTCEMGSAYNALKAEKIQLAAELEAAVNDLGGVKEALADREKSLEESREANKALVAEIEKMGKQRTELMGQMKLMNTRCISQEKYVSDWAKKMIALLGDFCMDVEAEAADIERSVIPNVPLGDEANRDMLRVHIRLGRVGPFIGRLREVVGQIDKELWPEDDSQREIEGLMTRLEDVPNRVQA